MPGFVTGFARVQYILNSGESSYGSFLPAARLTMQRHSTWARMTSELTTFAICRG